MPTETIGVSDKGTTREKKRREEETEKTNTSASSCDSGMSTVLNVSSSK